MSELHAMNPYERANIARQMDALNAEHRQDNPNLPDIQITVGKDAAGMERLDDIVTKVPNDSKAWFKPWTWFQSSEITKDVYDPEYDKHGNGWLQKDLEAISYRNKQLAELLGDTRR